MLTSDNDQFFFGTTTQFHGASYGTKAFAMNTQKYRRTVLFTTQSDYSLDTAVSSLSSSTAPFDDYNGAVIDEIIINAADHADEYTKDNWVWPNCPQEQWMDMAWSFCALVNEENYADCSE